MDTTSLGNTAEAAWNARGQRPTAVARDRPRRSHEWARLPLDLAETVLTFVRHGWSESYGTG
jgi:hypothetical protein